VSGCQKTPPNKSQALLPLVKINAETSKAKPKTEFWRAMKINRLTRQAYKKQCPQRKPKPNKQDKGKSQTANEEWKPEATQETVSNHRS